MERLGRQEPARTLSEAQKKEIAEINSLFQSKIAERETFLRSKIAEAQAAGAFEEIAGFEKQLARDLVSIREDWEARKDKVWKQA
jgi:hypothetical protein